MRRFFRNILSSCLGTLLFLIILTAVFLIIGVSSSQKPSYKKNSVLKLNLNMVIPEKNGNSDPFSGLMGEKTLGLNEILQLVERAKEDEKIEGILIDSSLPQLGMANTLTVRKALEDFKSEGKFVYAYSSSYSQLGYYLSSVADSVYLNPNGMLDMRGMSVSMPFFKDLSDDLGITWNIYYAGQFKSATEPMRRNEMSDQNRLQLREFINEVYDNYLLDIASSRKISVETIDAFVNNLDGFNPENALEIGLIDELLYKDGLTSRINERLGMDEDKKISYVDLFKYQLVSSPAKPDKSKDKIAVVYAEGDIVDTGKEKGTISSENYVEILKKIRNKKNIKAVVLRINSGGGSGFASDEIWREIELIKDEGKPVIVSMGDYAASGGYYIACNADSIVASPNTLTGSIGVFAMIPNFSKMAEEKLNIHFDSVKTHRYATAFNAFYEFSEGENNKLQTYIDKFYEQFLGRVAEGRGMTRDEVHEVAQGRIWTGRKAREIGLIDELGELDKAIEIAAQKASLDTYKLTNYPKFKTSYIEQIIKNMDLEAKIPGLEFKNALDQFKPYSSIVTDQDKYGTPQTYLPYQIDIN